MGQSQPEGSIAPMHKHREANGLEEQLQLDGKKWATRRWAGNKGGRAKKEKTNSLKAS
jgi:hypothetical protein